MASFEVTKPERDFVKIGDEEYEIVWSPEMVSKISELENVKRDPSVVITLAHLFIPTLPDDMPFLTCVEICMGIAKLVKERVKNLDLPLTSPPTEGGG